MCEARLPRKWEVVSGGLVALDDLECIPRRAGALGNMLTIFQGVDSDVGADAEAQIDMLPGWDHVDGGIRVVWSPDGRPMRELHPRSRRPIGRYNSRKAGRELAHESRASPNGKVGGEKLALMLCEIDPNTIDMRTQHITFELHMYGSLVAYTPDIVRLMADGSIGIVEAKADDRWKLDTEYRAKIELVAELCANIGVGFAVWTNRMMAPTERVRDNVIQIQMERYAGVETAHELLVHRELSLGGGTASFGDLRRVLGGGPSAGSFIRAMMCRGLLRLPLADRITDATTVTLVGNRQALEIAA